MLTEKEKIRNRLLTLAGDGFLPEDSDERFHALPAQVQNADWFHDHLVKYMLGAKNQEKIEGAYQRLDVANKARARLYLGEVTKDALEVGYHETAEDLTRLMDFILTRNKNPQDRLRMYRERKAKVRVHEDRIENAAAFQLAYAMLRSRIESDPDSPQNWDERIANFATIDMMNDAEEYVEWIRDNFVGPEPEVHEVAKVSARVSLGRAPSGQGRRSKPATERAAREGKKA